MLYLYIFHNIMWTNCGRWIVDKQIIHCAVVYIITCTQRG